MLESVDWTTSTGPGAATPAAWCAAVGPALLIPGPGAAGAVDELAVVSWNVRVGGGDVERLVADLRSGALTGRPVDDFVLLLQETWRAGPEVPSPSPDGRRLTSRIEAGPPSGERADVAELALRLGLHALYVPSMPNGVSDDPGAHAEDRGNAILATLPLGDPAALELPFEVQRRVAVAGTVQGITGEGEPWTLRVASGHLDTRSRWSRVLYSFGSGRARQASALGAWLDDDAALLGADLNTWSLGFLEDALEILQLRFPDTPRVHGATYASGPVRRRLDHLLFRLPDGQAPEAHRVAERYGSDHHPLVGVLRLGSAARNSSPLSRQSATRP